MYTIISATNRIGSVTLKVAKQYQSMFAEQSTQVNLLSLESMTSLKRDEVFNQMESDFLIPTEKFIFIMPEYNGSFPGIFKLMMDISDITTCWYHKKVMLVGVSSGRAGNLRGMDIMTNMCHYMKMNVFPQKLPLSSISNEIQNDVFVNPKTIETIQAQIAGFIKY